MLHERKWKLRLDVFTKGPEDEEGKQPDLIKEQQEEEAELLFIQTV